VIFIDGEETEAADRHVAPLGHIILIPSQPVFALSPLCCVLSREATNTNFIVFGLIQPGLEPTIYHTRGEHAILLYVVIQIVVNLLQITEYVDQQPIVWKHHFVKNILLWWAATVKIMLCLFAW
jgi:hypothetical protein